MKDIRVFQFLNIKPDNQRRYRNFFKFIPVSDRIWRFKARVPEKMQFDEFMLIRMNIDSGLYLQAMSKFFCFRIPIPYLSFRKSDNDPENHLSLCIKKAVFFIGIPVFVLSRLRVSSFFPAFNYMKEEVKRISISEEKTWYLIYDNKQQPDEEDENLMRDFGPMNILRSVAIDRNLLEEDVSKWTYGRVSTEIQMKERLKYIASKNLKTNQE